MVACRSVGDIFLAVDEVDPHPATIASVFGLSHFSSAGFIAGRIL